MMWHNPSRRSYAAILKAHKETEACGQEKTPDPVERDSGVDAADHAGRVRGSRTPRYPAVPVVSEMCVDGHFSAALRGA